MKDQKKISSAFKKASKIASILCISVGFIVLIGWIFDITILKSVFPNQVSMKANTALMFILAGLSLLFAQEEEPSKNWKKYLSKIAATLIVLISIATLCEIIFGWNLGIDQLFFKEAPGEAFASSLKLGRMSTMAAISFLFVGVSLLFIGKGYRIRISQLLCFFILIFSFTGMAGYIYGVAEFNTFFATPIALNSTITFFILATGIFFVYPNSGFMQLVANNNIGGSIIRRLIPATTIAITFLGYTQIFWHHYQNINIYGPENNDLRLHIASLVILSIFVSATIIWIAAIDANRVDSERKLIAVKLKIETDKIDVLLESIGDAVIAIDKDWNITLWNKAATRLSGWTSKEVMGKPFRNYIKLINAADRTENITFIEDTMVTKKIHNLEGGSLLINKDQKDIPVGDSAGPILDLDEEIAGVIIVMRNTTKEKSDALSHSDFAYASHQLRTPITKALWSLEPVLASNNIKEVKAGASEAFSALQSIQKLSEELIDVSEVDQGTIIPDIEKVIITDIFSSIIDSAITKALNYKVQIIVPTIPDNVSLNTSQTLLKRALTEVLDNAIIYSPKGGKVLINIKVNDDKVTFEIHDSGLGITSEHQPLIFTKFFRGSNYETSKIAGAGLGLYLAKEYITLLKGKIWFKSKEGAGTTFYISMPRFELKTKKL